MNKLYYPAVGGIERVVQQISEGLMNTFALTVLACQPKGKTDISTINGVTVYKASSFGTYFSMPISLSFFYYFFRLSRQTDIIQIHMPFPLADMALLLSLYRGKVVVWWHSDIVRQKKFLIFYKPIMRYLLKRADVIIVATKEHITYSDFLPDFSYKCVVIPYGVKENKQDSFIHSCKKHKRKDQKVQLLFVGRLVYYKGCSFLIDAMRKVTGCTLTIIGSGVLEQALKQKVEELNLSRVVRFKKVSNQEELEHEFASCDVFVLPSIAKSEAFGLVQIEAMAYGKPIINTQLKSGVPCVSINGLTGLTVPPCDSDSLAEAIQSLADNEELRRLMGLAARERVVNCFTEERMLGALTALYKRLIGREG